ncbi:hypothetical protein [Deinococcus multiflagellatus]|uniref:N-acetyltransferase domain-containing protein n=1 Tax=Deinococcus multiflagellatus TaxID=1656887 RepID=A0ABW1ZL07_9DEIO|nr:hypothetical protein [Deinococcus multiflagellatus]MBZ9713899.1 hypothetical protein [Deinococcus multiflagellatus]
MLFEGYTADERLALPDEQLRALALTDEPVVFRIGSSEVLGQFTVSGDTLILELAQIDDGGEGVLAALASRYARQQGLGFVEWRVHALHCARPNLRLRRMMELKGLTVHTVPGVGECLWRRVAAGPA